MDGRNGRGIAKNAQTNSDRTNRYDFLAVDISDIDWPRRGMGKSLLRRVIRRVNEAICYGAARASTAPSVWLHHFPFCERFSIPDASPAGQHRSPLLLFLPRLCQPGRDLIYSPGTRMQRAPPPQKHDRFALARLTN